MQQPPSSLRVSYSAAPVLSNQGLLTPLDSTPPTNLRQKEKLPTFVYGPCNAATQSVANHVAQLIRSKTPPPSSADASSEELCSSSSKVVLGLTADSALAGVYEELVRQHQEEGLSFRNVVTFTLHEYYPMAPSALQSLQNWLHSHLLEHVDILPENVHYPDCTAPMEEMEKKCEEYASLLHKHFPIDLFLIGMSSGGRVGFNEPGEASSSSFADNSGKKPEEKSNKEVSKATEQEQLKKKGPSVRRGRTWNGNKWETSVKSGVMLVELEQGTRVSAASDFFGVNHVPNHGVTLDLGWLLDSTEVIAMAFSEGKAKVIRSLVEGDVTPNVPVSLLQKHDNCVVVADEAAGAELTRFKCPWMLGGAASSLRYDDFMERKAVIWLALATKKPILRLTEEDYSKHHLLQLIKQRGSAYNINIRVFRHLSGTITGWPGGKSTGPTTGKNATFPKRVLVFSPHPDDDVISMGGTLIRLAEQGHEVHVCYQTTGNIAVWDDHARSFAHFATEFIKLFGISSSSADVLSRVQSIESTIEQFIASKQPAQPDCEELKLVKGLVRRVEAREAARYCGVAPERIHNLELPFYETGKVRKKPLGEEDIQLVLRLMDAIKPHQIYAAGDLSDPHGTHRVCLQAILAAIDRLQQRSEEGKKEEEKEEERWFVDQRTEVWLYRGAWQEWEPEKIHMAVPLSPEELQKKRYAIFKHQSQKDVAPFPGNDSREFWQRSEARNRATAALYDALGLPEYEAIEAFVMYDKSLHF
ncbi:Glucosamine-6-phosphate deaminase [Balamuthia mandrillaris]